MTDVEVVVQTPDDFDDDFQHRQQTSVLEVRAHPWLLCQGENAQKLNEFRLAPRTVSADDLLEQSLPDGTLIVLPTFEGSVWSALQTTKRKYR